MPHWLIKSAAQHVISWLPASHRWNELFQTHVTRSLDLTPERFDMRLSYCGKHFEQFRRLRPERVDFTVLELGTGWYPVVPVGLYLCGAGQQHTYDISPLLTGARVRLVFERFLEYEREGRLAKFLPGARADRIAHLRETLRRHGDGTEEAMLNALGIAVHVRDASETGLAAGSIDLTVSTGVLEYIPEPVLRAIMKEFGRVGIDGHVQSHYINLADQFWYFDRSITPYNFLRYSDGAWKWFNSPLTWQNRMRINDYRALFARSGYSIAHEEASPGEPADLKRVPLAPRFRSYKAEDLLVLYAWIVATTEPGRM